VLERVGAKTLFCKRAHAAFDTSDAASLSPWRRRDVARRLHNVGNVPIFRRQQRTLP